VVATPIYKAAYSGLLKIFLDVLPQFGLREKVVFPLATGGTVAHVLALDYALRPVLSSLDPVHVVSGLFILDKQRFPVGSNGVMQDLRAHRRLGLARLAQAALGVSLSALLLGCSSGGSGPEQVGVARQEALSAPFSTTIVLSAPLALTPTAPVLEAAGSIVIGSIATISGSTVAMGTGPGGVNAGPQAVLNDTWSRGGVNLGPQLHLTGTLHASTVTADPTAVVGTYDRTPVFDPVSTVSWNVAFPSPLSAAVHVLNGQSKALVPGGYSNLSVDAGGTVTLASGTYFLSSLTITAGSTVKLNQANGPVIVYVSDAITINATLKSLTGDPPNLLVGFVGTSAVTLGASGAPFNGALVAPFAQLSLLQASAPHAGFFAAHDISIGALTRVQYVRPAAVSAVTSPLPFNSVATPTRLPPPPDVRGCYVGTWNGWATVPCSPYADVPASIRHKPYIGGGQVLLPGYLDGGIASFGPIPGISSSSGLKFGQVEGCGLREVRLLFAQRSAHGAAM